jgi:hypothetical protein
VTLSWLAFVILVAGAGGFATWIYVRRELPIPGRRLLGTIRASILVLVLLLLWDLRLPGGPRSGGADGSWVLLDVSTSMSAGGSADAAAGGANWVSALGRAEELADAGAQVLLFGETPRVVSFDSLDTLLPLASASRLAPALARAAEAGATDVTVLSDLRLDDPVEAELSMGRFLFGVQIEGSGAPVRNAGVARFELPPRAESGTPLSVGIALFSEGTEPGDTIQVEVWEEERLVASAGVLAVEPGLLATATIRLPPPRDTGWLRYHLLASLPGDRFVADDAKSAFTEVDPTEGGLVLLSLQPDWEPRFLLPVLSQVTGLDSNGFLSLSGGRYLRLGSGSQVGPPVDEAEVREALSGADFVVLHGFGAGAADWVGTTLAEAPRSIVFPSDPPGALASGVEASAHLDGEWYVMPDLPPSPLAASLSGADLTGLPPLTAILPWRTPGTVPTPIPLQRQGSGPMEAGLVLDESRGRRRAVVLASGFWRWAFREGPDREVYRRLWAGVAGWLLASAPQDGATPVRPEKRVWSSREPMAWRAPGWIGGNVRLALSVGDSVVLDTTVVVDGSGRARTRALPVAEYSYRITSPGEDGSIGSGRIESEGHTLELLRRPVDISLTESDAAGGVPTRVRLGPPIRTHPGPYLLILVLLSAEWIGRRRGGLR